MFVLVSHLTQPLALFIYPKIVQGGRIDVPLLLTVRAFVCTELHTMKPISLISFLACFGPSGA